MKFVGFNEDGYVIQIVENYENLSASAKEKLGDGKLVESLPRIEYQFGKEGRHKWDDETESVVVVYLDRDLTQEEEIVSLKQRIEALENQVVTQ
jgi:hypothetical protein